MSVKYRSQYKKWLSHILNNIEHETSLLSKHNILSIGKYMRIHSTDGFSAERQIFCAQSNLLERFKETWKTT